MNPSKEQIAIIRQLKDGNVVVDSVAGCGKTSTVKFVAMTFMRERILVLVYNTRQRKNTSAVMKYYGLNNIEVHTFHSACRKYYDETCMRNSGINEVVMSDAKPRLLLSFNIFIVDEVQDFNSIYHRFVCKLMKDSQYDGIGKRILLLGDYEQAINAFNDSNIDYILNPESHFGEPFTHLQLSETFRLTQPMVDLVNRVQEYSQKNYGRSSRIMRTSKAEGCKPKYFIADSQFASQVLIDYVRKYDPYNILVLTPSVNKSHQIKELCNLLTGMKIPIYISSEYKSGIEESMNGKLVISTIHEAKGSERKCVFLFGFDDSVLPKMVKDDNCVIYVALTRALEELVIVHNPKNSFIIPRDIVEQTCELAVMDRAFDGSVKNKLNRETKASVTEYSVTGLVKYLSHDKVQRCLKLIEVTELIGVGECISAPGIAKSLIKNSVEEVSDINGCVIPNFHAKFNYNFAELEKYFLEKYKKTPISKIVKKHLNTISQIDFASATIHDILYTATVYHGLCQNMLYRIEQIAEYNWLSIEFLKQCSERIADECGRCTRYEIPVFANTKFGTVSGIIDCISETQTVYEFKCTSILEEEHILQLALYSCLYEAKSYKLFNIYSGQVLEVKLRENVTLNDLLEILI